MKAIGELLFYLAFITIVGNTAYKQIYKTTKKEALEKVNQGLPSLSAYTLKLTQN
jgi:hypothetical protein